MYMAIIIHDLYNNNNVLVISCRSHMLDATPTPWPDPASVATCLQWIDK